MVVQDMSFLENFIASVATFGAMTCELVDGSESTTAENETSKKHGRNIVVQQAWTRGFSNGFRRTRSRYVTNLMGDSFSPLILVISPLAHKFSRSF